MTTETIHEVETVTRSIARWGSLAAAIIFGVTFALDKTRTTEMIMDQATHIVLAAAIFVGYALAWSQKYEILGSVIALVSLVALCFFCTIAYGALPNLFLLAVGAPAAFHLVAVALHRQWETQRKVKSN